MNKNDNKTTKKGLLESKQEREKHLERVEVLDKVKALILLPNDIGATTQMVANYFEVDKATIEYHIYTNKEHAEELKENGMSIVSKDTILLTLPNQVKTKRGGFDILDEKGNIIDSGSNKGITVLTRRAILNLAMMLEGSLVAKEIRKQLLDAAEEKEVKQAVVNNIDEEKMLRLAILEAENDEEMLIAINKLDNFRKRHIKELQNTIEEQTPKVESFNQFLDTTNTLTWDIVARNLDIGKNTLLRTLRELEILQTDTYLNSSGKVCYGENHNVPYQRYMKYFDVKFIIKDDHRYAKVLVLAAGQEYIRKRLNNIHTNEEEVAVIVEEDIVELEYTADDFIPVDEE